MNKEEVRSIIWLFGIAVVAMVAAVATGIAANFVINAVTAQLSTSGKLDWAVIAVVFGVLSVVIVLIGLLVQVVLGNRRALPETVERWTLAFQLYGIGLFLALFLIYFCGYPFSKILRGSNLVYLVFIFLPFAASLIGSRFVAAAFAETIEFAYTQIDRLLRKDPRVTDAAIGGKIYPKAKKISPARREIIHEIMRAYPDSVKDRSSLAENEILVLDRASKPEQWALVRGPKPSGEQTASELACRSRENQQAIYCSKWLDRGDTHYFYLLKRMTEEPEGLSPATWKILILALEDLQRRKLAEQKRARSDEIYGQAKKKADLTPQEHQQLNQLEELLKHHPDPAQVKGILIDQGEMESSEPIAWRLVAMIVADLEAKDGRGELKPEDRGLLIHLQEALKQHPEAKTFEATKKTKKDYEREQRAKDEQFNLDQWLDQHNPDGYVALVRMAQNTNGLSNAAWERIERRRIELIQAINDTGQPNPAQSELLDQLENIIGFKNHPEKGA